MNAGDWQYSSTTSRATTSADRYVRSLTNAGLKALLNVLRVGTTGLYKSGAVSALEAAATQELDAREQSREGEKNRQLQAAQAKVNLAQMNLAAAQADLARACATK